MFWANKSKWYWSAPSFICLSKRDFLATYASTPIIDFIPSFLHVLKKLTAPYMPPWSVIATAGWLSSLAVLINSGMRDRPSSIEYSVWTCRWTNCVDIRLSLRHSRCFLLPFGHQLFCQVFSAFGQ